MLDLSCLCGAVRLRTAHVPAFVHDCNCTLCSKTGARWGYFHPSEVEIGGKTLGFVRTDKEGAGAEVHFCPICGATIHFGLTAAMIDRHGDTMRGVNTRLASDTELAGVEVRYPDGRAWSGAGEFGYVQPSRVIGSTSA